LEAGWRESFCLAYNAQLCAGLFLVLLKAEIMGRALGIIQLQNRFNFFLQLKNKRY
jgi:hypothetical protein